MVMIHTSTCLTWLIPVISQLMPVIKVTKICWSSWCVVIVTRPKNFRLTRKKLLSFKNKTLKNNHACLVICVGVLALIWYLFCDKWVWNDKILDIWLHLRHIKKFALQNPVYISVCMRYSVDWAMSCIKQPRNSTSDMLKHSPHVK